MATRLLLISALSLACLHAGAATPVEDNVRIYRCVGSSGAVSLQDAPCSSGHQQVLDMQRPQDPPPRTAPIVIRPDATATSAAPPREVRIVTVQPPQPMYECVNDEGTRYTSDNAEGNPRWVPVWTSGHLPVLRGHGSRPPRPPGHRPPTAGELPHRPSVIVPAGSTLVRDTCHALPPQEVCARLTDRRWELIRRYNSALQSEREQLVREQRGIDARLDQDCGGA